MNRKRVQMLRDMIWGIPEEKMHLNTFYAANGNPCGTIACIAGWAAIYPPFVRQGLHKDKSFDLPSYQSLYGMDAAAKFFDVPATVFSDRYRDRGDYHGMPSDKQIALRRLDALLK